MTETVTCPECETVLLGSGGVCPRCGSPVGEQKEREVLDEQGRSTGISVVPLLKASPNQPPPTPIELEERRGDDGKSGGFLEMAGDSLELDTGAMSERQQKNAGFVTQYEDQGQTGGFLKMKGDVNLDVDQAALQNRRRKPPPPGFAARTHSDSGAPILDGSPPPAATPAPTPAAPMVSMEPPPNPFGQAPISGPQVAPRPLPGAAPPPQPLPGASPSMAPPPMTSSMASPPHTGQGMMGPPPTGAGMAPPRPRSNPNVRQAPSGGANLWPIVAGFTVLAAIGVVVYIVMQRGG